MVVFPTSNPHFFVAEIQSVIAKVRRAQVGKSILKGSEQITYHLILLLTIYIKQITPIKPENERIFSWRTTILLPTHYGGIKNFMVQLTVL